MFLWVFMMSGAKWYIAGSFEPKSPVESITPLTALTFRNFPFVGEPGMSSSA